MDQPSKRTVKCRAHELDRLRQARGLSTEQLAAKAGVNLRTLQRWLSGGRAFVGNIDAVAEVLKVPAEAIIDAPSLCVRLAHEDHTARFTLQMSISGTVQSAEQARRLADLPPSVIAEMQRLGIHIEQSNAQVLIAAREQERTRIVCLLYAHLHNGNPCWIYASVRPSMYDAFTKAQAARTLDLYHFQPFGEIVVSGEGAFPSLAIISKVCEMYSIQEPPEHLHEQARRSRRDLGM